MKIRNSHYKPLIRLGLPIMVGQLGVILLSFADTMMVGRYSTEALAAAAFVNNMFNLVIVFATGFSYGLTPVVGSMFGSSSEGEKGNIGAVLKNAFAVNSVAAAVLSVIMLLLYFNIHRLGQPSELLPLMRPYYITLLTSLFFVLIFNAFKQFSEGVTDTKTPMLIILGGNVLNILLNWMLIYGKAGFPQMGLLGAGIATLASRVMMVVAAVAFLLFSKRFKDYRKGLFEGRLNRVDFGRLVRLGMPVGLQMGMETASFSFTAIMVGWLGATALAAHQVMLTVGQLGFMMYYGMAAAVAVRVSNFNGRGDLSEVRNVSKAGFRLILCMAAVTSCIVMLLRFELGNIFADNAEVAAMVAQLVIPFVVYQIGDGMQCNYSNALRGIEDVRMVSVYAFIAYFLISLPSAYIFGFIFDLGLPGIWLSFPLGLTSAGLMFYVRFRRTLKLRQS